MLNQVMRELEKIVVDTPTADIPALIGELERLKAWRQSHREIWSAWRQGERGVSFPAGSYLMRVLYFVRCDLSPRPG